VRTFSRFSRGGPCRIDAWGNLTKRNPVSGKTNYEPLNAAPATNNRLATVVHYYFADHLGSASVVTNGGGTHCAGVLSEGWATASKCHLIIQ
jgi:hypothetical protein